MPMADVLCLDQTQIKIYDLIGKVLLDHYWKYYWTCWKSQGETFNTLWTLKYGEGSIMLWVWMVFAIKTEAEDFLQIF